MVLFLVETDGRRRVLDTDALDVDILLKVFEEIKKEWMEEFVLPVRDSEGESWELLDKNGDRIDKVRESKKIAMTYFRECYYGKIKPNTEKFLELVREKGFYVKFLAVANDILYL